MYWSFASLSTHCSVPLCFHLKWCCHQYIDNNISSIIMLLQSSQTPSYEQDDCPSSHYFYLTAIPVVISMWWNGVHSILQGWWITIHQPRNKKRDSGKLEPINQFLPPSLCGNIFTSLPPNWWFVLKPKILLTLLCSYNSYLELVE